MGTVYAIANQKGGVGQDHHRRQRRRLHRRGRLRDAAGRRGPAGQRDGRARASPRDEGPGLYEVLAGDVTAAEAVKRDRASSTSRCSSRRPDLAGATMELPRLPGSEGRMRDALTPVRGAYAFTLLDCPPSLGPLTVNALVAADRVIVPGADRVLRARGARRPARHARADPARAQPAADDRRDAADHARRAHASSPRTSRPRSAGTSRSSSSTP